MDGKKIKIVASLLLFFIIFFVYEYFWGTMYGGRKFQRKAYIAEAKLLLDEYHKDQEFYFRQNKKYDRILHQSSKYKGDYKNFRLGFADSTVVSKYCSDCVFTDIGYKIAAYDLHKTEETVLTIDNLGQKNQIR